MTTITINRDVFAQHIQGLIEVMRMPNSEHVADAHNKAVRFLHAALAAQPSNYSDWQQRRGVLADIVDEALASYEAWMAEDDYNATDALHKIMDHMRQRAASYAKPAQQPAPAWHDAPDEREAFEAFINAPPYYDEETAWPIWQAACARQREKDAMLCEQLGTATNGIYGRNQECADKIRSGE